MLDESVMRVGRKRKKKVDSVTEKWGTIINKSLITQSKVGHKSTYASTAGLCSRQTALYQLVDESEVQEMKTSSQFYFAIGSTIEDVMSRAFDKVGIELDRETRVSYHSEEVNVTGRVDFVLTKPENDEEFVLMELKSCGKLPSSPRPSHMAQLMIYLAITGIDEGLIWYVSRNVATFDGKIIQKVFEVNPTETELRYVLTQLVTGSVYSNRGLIPPIPSHIKKYKCGFCPFKRFCWDDDIMSIDINGINPTVEEEIDLHPLIEMLVDNIIEERDGLNKAFYDVILG